MKFLKSILLILTIFFSINLVKAGEINLLVSPIKYEIETQTGATIYKKAKILNRSDDEITIFTGKSDFMAKDGTGNPQFVRKSELAYPDQQLSTWIDVDVESFTLAPKEEKEIGFTITVPENATPGGHYGAVFFKNNNFENNSDGNIKINVDYGVLLLVHVDGEIIDKGEVEEPEVKPKSGGGGYSWAEYLKDNPVIDDCPIDLTKSNTDGKCIDFIELGEKIDETIDETQSEETKEKINLDDILADFNIEFEIPFKNDGNTHLKPTGKITLIDEEGNEIKGVGKEIIQNEEGAIIGEKIVDYLPVNDLDGNVLPFTKRIFKSEWKGFPYEAFDEAGKRIIKYWTPSEYYTKKNVEDRDFIFPWERVSERLEQKKVTAVFDLEYQESDGEVIEFNSAKEFYVDYKEQYVGINPYFILFSIFGILFIYLIFLFIIKRNKKECINQKCKEKLKKNMKICPYCGVKQDDKRYMKKKDKNKKKD